ncbi:hypothetical protein BGZ83_011970 [Gryganskiella cystojenkinii]|nr:hypothetical protein BGZ83_011970 [Gryganskiella cystojenkinii]
MSQLPDHCIKTIVSHLRGDIYTLGRLLTVNSTFFHITLPILYHDPYRLLERQIKKNHARLSNAHSFSPPAFESSLPAKRLLYLLLLSCRQADDLVPFLSPDWSDPLPPFGGFLTVTYINYLGDLNFDRWTATLKHLLPEFDTTMEQRAYRLFRVLFLDHHKSRVTSLTIPITHLEPYQQWAGEFKNLQRIRFYEDTVEEEEEQPVVVETTTVAAPVSEEQEQQPAGQVQQQQLTDTDRSTDATNSNITDSSTSTNATSTEQQDEGIDPEIAAAVAAIEAAVSAANAAAELAAADALAVDMAAALSTEISASVSETTTNATTASPSGEETDPSTTQNDINNTIPPLDEATNAPTGDATVTDAMVEEVNEEPVEVTLPSFILRYLNPVVDDSTTDAEEDDDLDWVFVDHSLFAEFEANKPVRTKVKRPPSFCLRMIPEAESLSVPLEDEPVDPETLNMNAFAIMPYHDLELEEIEFEGPFFSILDVFEFFEALPFSLFEEEEEEEEEDDDPEFYEQAFSALAFWEDTRLELEVEFQRELFSVMAFFDFDDDTSDEEDKVQEQEIQHSEAEDNFCLFSELAFWDATLEEIYTADKLELFAIMAFAITEESERFLLAEEAEDKFTTFAAMVFWPEIQEELERMENFDHLFVMAFATVDGEEVETQPADPVTPTVQEATLEAAAAAAQEQPLQDPPVQEEQQQQEEEQQPAATTRPPVDASIKGAAFLKSLCQHFPAPPVKQSKWNPAPNPHLLEILPPKDWTHSNWSGNATHDSKYIRLLESINNPNYLEFEEWEHYASYIERLPLSRVKRLRTFCTDWSEEPLVNMGRVLKRCRGLERFSSRLVDDKMFQWALEEKKDRLTRLAQIEDKTARRPFEDEPCLDLVPLRKIVMRNGSEDFIVPVLKDICAGFDQTLEWIEARLYYQMELIDLNMFTMLPKLTVLYLHQGRHQRFVNGAEFLNGCPCLEVLRLIDDDDYKECEFRSIGQGIQPAWDLPNLRELELTGSVAGQFNYATLNKTQKLEHLTLEYEIVDIGITPLDENFQEYLCDPSWSWTWSLPLLKTCKLRGLPAHLFEFRFLLQCPSLCDLTLDLEKPVRRAITPARDVIPVGPSGPMASIQSLTLRGRWVINETPDLLAQLLKPFSKQLYYLSMQEAEFSSVESMVESLHALPILRKVRMHRHVMSKFDAWTLGLEPLTWKPAREWDRSTRVMDTVNHIKDTRQKALDDARELAAWEKELAESEQGIAAYFDVLESAFSPLSFESEQVAVEEMAVKKKDEEEIHEVKDRSRCESVDSACELSDDSIPLKVNTETDTGVKMIQLEMQNIQVQIEQDAARCVFVFKGRRYSKKM